VHDIDFPARKTEDARRVDQELVTLLEQMTSGSEPITVRAVVRRMSTLNQPSSITRDVWRMGWIMNAEQERIRRVADGLVNLDEGFKRQVPGNRIVPDVRCLLSFASIARAGNFGYAARELQVSQPTLSRQMQSLEETFAVKLLIRHGRGVTLTQAGSRLTRRLETALPLLTAPLNRDRLAEHDVGMTSSSSETGNVSFGVIPGIFGSLMPGIVPQFRARWPDVKLRVDEQSSAKLEERLIAQRLDVAVLQDPPLLEALSTEPILTDRFGLVASAHTSVGSNRSTIRLHDLASLPLVLPQTKDNVRRRLEKACFQHGLRLCPSVETDSVQVVQAMVRSGLAFTVLPSLMVLDEVGWGRLIFRDIEQPAITTVHAISANRLSRSPPFVPEFIALVRDAMITLVGSGDNRRAQAVR
jgi:LysR family nitrogen assimilation transcriptional regulator